MKTYVIISGYFNPIHPGHIDYLTMSKALGDELWVIINNDKQAELKRGKISFQDEEFRMCVVGAIKSVDKVILSIDVDKWESGEIPVIHSLEKVALLIRAQDSGAQLIFANGGDRNENLNNIPEAEVCKRLGIHVIDGLGEKTHHSRNYIVVEEDDILA